MLPLLLALVGFLTAALSGVAGLGGGTILIATLYAVGLTPAVAIPLFSVVQFVSNLTRTLSYLRHVEWRALGWFALTGVPTPFLVAPLVVNAEVAWIQILLGLLILISLRPTRPDHTPMGPRRAFALAGLLNGTIGMFVGATGLFVGRLFFRPEWRKETIVGTLAATQALGHVLKVAGFATIGFALSQHLDLLLPLVAAVILGTLAGRRLHNRLPEATFRRLFQLILAVLSTLLIINGVRGLWN
jgi:uncharacterized membrane protein YfcA